MSQSTPPQARTVELAPGVYGPRTIKASEPQILAATIAYQVEAHITYSEQHGRYVCQSVAITGASVTGHWIRRVRVDAMLRDAVRDRIQALPRPRGLPDDEPWGLIPPDGIGEDGPTDRTIRWVAHLHQIGNAIGTPAQFVAVQLGVPQSTAGRWITKANRGKKQHG